MVRIPRSMNTLMTLSRESDYVLSYKTYMTLHRPNFISKDANFIYIGFEVLLDEYIDNSKLIEKGEKIIKEMLELF